MITFQVEKLRDVKEEAMPLLREHWEEIALNKDTVPLDPLWDQYQAVEDMGLYHVVTARAFGNLIGYSTYTLCQNFHYASLRQAETDIFWLQPKYRRGMTGIRLLKFAEQSLKELGCNKIITKTKLHLDLGPVLEFMGFTPIERVYAKSI